MAERPILPPASDPLLPPPKSGGLLDTLSEVVSGLWKKFATLYAKGGPHLQPTDSRSSEWVKNIRLLLASSITSRIASLLGTVLTCISTYFALTGTINMGLARIFLFIAGAIIVAGIVISEVRHKVLIGVIVIVTLVGLDRLVVRRRSTPAAQLDIREIAKEVWKESPFLQKTPSAVRADMPSIENDSEAPRSQRRPEQQLPKVTYRPYSPVRAKPIFGQMTRNRAEVLIDECEWFRSPATIDVYEVYEFSLYENPAPGEEPFSIFLEREGRVHSELSTALSINLIQVRVFLLEKHGLLGFAVVRDYKAQVELTTRGADIAIPYAGPNVVGFTLPKWSFIAAVKALDGVTGIAPASSLYGPNSLEVKYAWEWRPTEIGIASKRMYEGIQESTARLKLYDDGWRCEKY